MTEETQNIVCPYCGGEGKIYWQTYLKVMHPLLFLTPKYICINCKELFNESHKAGLPYKTTNKTSKTISNIAKAAVIVLFIWFLYTFISAATK